MQHDAPNLFGTDGIRGAMGAAPLTLEHLARLGNAIAYWACEYYKTTPHILIGHDTRESCAFMKAALCSGLLLHNIHVYDAHIISTPALCQLVQKDNQFTCGIMISASHNPYHDNGIKIVDATKGKLSLKDELRISELFYQLSLNQITYTSFGTNHQYTHALTTYSNYITSFFPPLFLEGIKVVIDCAHGAQSLYAPIIFKQFGADVITINNQPDGKNINHHCGALHLTSLQEAVITHQAHIGFAFDGDGDRVIAVNATGHIKNGDDILALLLQHPAYEATPAFVGTIMTNHGFANYLEAHNKKLFRTPVGDKYVAERLAQEKLLIGGEQSGHIILRDYLDTGDGLFTALRVAQTAVMTGNWSFTTFTKYPQLLFNIPIQVKKDLASQPIATIIKESQLQLQSGRLIVRYSGTENILRIMIEDYELNHAQHIGSQLSLALQKELSKV